MAQETSRRKLRVLLGVTGSVAAVKSPLVAVKISRELDADVIVLLSQAGETFWMKAVTYDLHSWNEFMKRQSDQVDFSTPTAAAPTTAAADNNNKIVVYEAHDEWKGWNRIGDPVLHIELRNWADIMVVAPLSAHTLAKIATGMCDDPLTCCIRAWDFGHGDRQGKPLALAPAMNTGMWEHVLTRSQLQTVRSFWNHARGINKIVIIEPKEDYKLACGDVGAGAMADVQTIVDAVKNLLEE